MELKTKNFMKPYWKDFCNSSKEYLWQVYKTSYSDEKEKSYNKLRQKMKDMNGEKMRIIRSNCNFYTLAFIAEYEGEIVFIVETVNHEYYCNISDVKEESK